MSTSWPNAPNAITTVSSSPGIDTNTIVESTTIRGVEVRRVTTEWATVIAPGAYDSHAPAYQIVKRTTVDSEWAMFGFINENGVSEVMPSTQLDFRYTTTELLTGILADADHGILWPDGNYYAGSGHATMIRVEKLSESYTWREDCRIQSSYVKREQNYSPLGSVLGAVAYADGTYRMDATYQWVTVSETRVEYGADGVGHSRLWRWRNIAAPDEDPDEQYGEIPLGAPEASIAAIAEIAGTDQPERGSASTPQVSEEIFTVDYDATDATDTTGGGGYTKRTEAPGTLPYPETVEELTAIAKRRIRRACSDTLDISHNLIPFLRVGDHVAVTNHARALVKADGYVTAIKRTASVLNGAFRQTTTVKIPPDWI